MIGAMRPGSERWSHPLVRATPPQLAGSGGQLLDTASAVSQSLHDLKAPRTVKFAPRRTPTHPAAALSAALSKCSPFWVALPRGRSTPRGDASEAAGERGSQRSARKVHSSFAAARAAASHSIAELLLLLLLLVATRGAQPEMHRKAARC